VIIIFDQCTKKSGTDRTGTGTAECPETVVIIFDQCTKKSGTDRTGTGTAECPETVVIIFDQCTKKIPPSNSEMNRSQLTPMLGIYN
jgi:hypothetical protein